MHFVIVILSQVTALSCAISISPWKDGYTQLQQDAYYVSVIIWTFLRKSAEISIILIVDILYQNQQEAVREDFYEEISHSSLNSDKP